MSHAFSLRQQLADLHAKRIRTWDPAALRLNVDQRRSLERQFDPATTPQPGDLIAPFELIDTAAGVLSLGQLVADGPAVLLFFRFAGCPACNIALPYYRQALAPALRGRGVPLVAVSPQVPERLREIRERHALDFIVASDPGNAFGRRMGILYSADEPSREAAQREGRFIGDLTGTGTWELPMPAALVIDARCRLRFIDVSPDWLVRTEAEPILEAVRQCQRDALPA